MARTMRALALALWTLAGTAYAQLSDPTRPPPEVSAPAANASGGSAPAVTPGQMRVQSILVSLRPGGRRIAVIDGKTVRPGDRVGGALVAIINSTEVILKRGSRTETLKLFRPAPRSMTVQP